MPVHDLLGDRQTQAGAAGLAGAGLVHPVKPLENASPVTLRDADAVVVHLHPHPVAGLPGGQCDASPVGGVFDGVGYDVHHHLHDPLPVRPHLGQVFRQAQLHGMGVILGVHQHRLIGVVHRLGKGEDGEAQLAAARVKPGEGEQVLQNMGHAVGFVEDDP